ncbi:MAG TPA: hypothetical protein P5287_00510 [bacterium]|nr:hypothetical protein [bacterium]
MPTKTPKTTKTTPVTDSLSGTKRSEITYKKDARVTSLYELLARTEDTIRELTRTMAELPMSRHMDVGGKMKLTEKEKIIKQELAAARARAERLMRIIEKQ